MKKLSFDELSSKMKVISDLDELARLLGGDDPWTIKGGTVENTSTGIKYTSSTGQVLNLPGVQFTMVDTPANGSAQLGGTIVFDPDTSDNDIGRLLHEYGHHLQEEKHGSLYYYTYIVPASLYSAATNTYEQHNDKPFEVEAKYLGMEFAKASNPYMYKYEIYNKY